MKIKLLVGVICSLLLGCSAGTPGADLKKDDKLRRQSKSEVLGNECSLPNYFWSSVVKISSEKSDPTVLIHFKQNKDSKVRSSVFSCGSQKDVASGDEQTQIIDFIILDDSSLVILRSMDSGQVDPWIGQPLRELKLELISQQTEEAVFFDSKQDDAVKYDLQGNESPSNPMSKDRTLFFASFSTLRIAKLYKRQKGFSLSYVGTGGYRIANFTSFGDKTPSIVELMPNTAANSDFFDRDAASLKFKGDEVFSTHSISPSDSLALKKRFGVDVKFSSSLKHQVLISKLNISSQMRIELVVTGEFSSFPQDVDVEGGVGIVLFNEIGSDRRKVTIQLFDTTTLNPIDQAHSPSPEMSSARAMKVCSGRIWVGGNAGFHQVSTGSVVKFGDAFLWSVDLNLRTQDLRVFGTDRDDDVTDIDCLSVGVLIGGDDNGPITHTGDTDSSQLYQQSFVGSY